MASTHAASHDARLWSAIVAAVVPLLLLFVAPAVGIRIPSLVVLLVLLWSTSIVLWRLRRLAGTAGPPSRDVTAAGEGAVRTAAAPAAPEAIPRRRPWLNVLLVVATLITTTAAGAAHQGVNVLEDPRRWAVGLPYGIGLMLVLGVHEMGHYLAARHHRISASLPYFIPIPFSLGTFGAFISMSGTMRTRRQLFDVGVAGPLAGLAVAIPALVIGLQWSRVLPVEAGMGGPLGHGVDVHASILLALISKLAIGDAMLRGHYLVLHPLAFAGWLGVMITALNLLPVGQLDGGHVAHALLGKARGDWIGKFALVAMVLLGLLVWSGLLFWALLILLIGGTKGAEPQDDTTPLDGRRRALAFATFALLALIIVPFPHVLAPGLGLHCPYV